MAPMTGASFISLELACMHGRTMVSDGRGAIIRPMKIAGLQKLTLLDYPGKTAATVFTPGCDFRCPFCHNRDLVVGERVAPGMVAYPEIALQTFYSFLDKRHGLIDGICITGGEPLMQEGIEEFCEYVHGQGFLVKLDTNGSFPGRLRMMVSDGLVDYVAMDVKNTPSCYGETIGVADFDVAPVRESIDFLLEDTVPYEFRTTVIAGFHDDDTLVELARWLTGARAWFLQGFIDSETVIAGEGHLSARPRAELEALLPTLQAILPVVELRGM